MKPGKSNYNFKLESKNVAKVHTDLRIINTKIPHPEDIKTFNYEY